jgi:hypothetical protein
MEIVSFGDWRDISQYESYPPCLLSRCIRLTLLYTLVDERRLLERLGYHIPPNGAMMKSGQTKSELTETGQV